MKSIGALAVAGLLVAALSACGDSESSGSPESSSDPSAGSGREPTRYCLLVEQAKDTVIPKAPKMDPKSLDLATMRAWFKNAVEPLPATTSAIIAAAPDAIAGDWRSIRTAQRGMADSLDAFLQPDSIAAWESLPLQKRAVEFLTQVLQPLADLDQRAPERINAEVQADCDLDLGMG